MEVKQICCIGAGYVGGPTMAIIAQKCPEISVTVVDINKQRIDLWNNSDLSKLPIYEPGLSEVIKETRGRNLFFSTDTDKAIKDSQMIFMAVNTPTKTYGKGKGMASDLKYIELCARRIAKVSKSDKIIIEKSTLPVRTAETIQTILQSTGSGVHFEVLSSPEFLAEGTAIEDLNNPDRVLIGAQDTDKGREASKALVKIYKNWISEDKILTTNVWSSELSKLVANAFLAQRISSINSISMICEKTGADIEDVSNAIGKDSRIGPKFLKASVGFGGSCFQKDILNLVYISQSLGLYEVANYWEQVILINSHQRTRFSSKVIETMFRSISGKKITFFGWAFKKNTNDSRESASIYIADNLIEEEASIFVYDPKIKTKQMLMDLNNLKSRNQSINADRLKGSIDPYKSVEGSHAVLIITDWDEFSVLDWKNIYQKMSKPAFIFDGRKILNKLALEKIGFKVFEIGKE